MLSSLGFEKAGSYAGYCKSPVDYQHVDHSGPDWADWRRVNEARCNKERVLQIGAVAAALVLPGWWKALAVPAFLMAGFVSQDGCADLARAAEEDEMGKQGYHRCE